MHVFYQLWFKLAQPQQSNQTNYYLGLTAEVFLAVTVTVVVVVVVVVAVMTVTELELKLELEDRTN